jgi:lipopolysaccharide export system protein LptC
MSELAERQRRERRAWAAAGSSHDRLIATLRVALPMVVGVLIAFLAFAPLTVGRDISFVLAKDRVEVARERMRVTAAVYRGSDTEGRPFELDADSAVQATSRDPIVRLTTLNAKIQQTTGPATIRAGHGRYDMNTQNIAIDGPVNFDSADGYHILTRNVLLTMNNRALVSRGPVTGTMPLGNFSADKMRARLDDRVVQLEGHVRLHIVQAQSKRPR